MEVKNTKCVVLTEGEVKFHFPGVTPFGEGKIWQPESQPFLFLEENDKDGGAEVHDKVQDVFVIIEGNPKFILGGKMVKPIQKSPGEWRAEEIKDGEEIILSPGDFLSVPAGTPHQRLANGEIFLLVFKILMK